MNTYNKQVPSLLAKYQAMEQWDPIDKDIGEMLLPYLSGWDNAAQGVDALSSALQPSIINKARLLIDPKITALQEHYPRDFMGFVLPDNRNVDDVMSKISRNKGHPKIAPGIKAVRDTVTMFDETKTMVPELAMVLKRAEGPLIWQCLHSI